MAALPKEKTAEFKLALRKLATWCGRHADADLPRESEDGRDLKTLLMRSDVALTRDLAVCRHREGALTFENACVVTLEEYKRHNLKTQTLCDVYGKRLRIDPIGRVDPTFGEVSAVFRGRPLYLHTGQGRTVIAYEATIDGQAHKRLVVLSPAPRFVVRGRWHIHGADSRGLATLPEAVRSRLQEVCDDLKLEPLVVRTRVTPTDQSRVRRSAYVAYAIAGDFPRGEALVRAALPSVAQHSFLTMRTTHGTFKLDIATLSDDGIVLLGFLPKSVVLARKALSVAAGLIAESEAVFEKGGTAVHSFAQIEEACGRNIDVLNAVNEILAGYGRYARGNAEFRWHGPRRPDDHA